MARTYDKATMDDISLFSTSTALEELEFLNPLSVIAEGGFLEEYDVYSGDGGDVNNAKLPPISLSAGELFEELDLEACNDFLDSTWMTEKVDFNSTEPVLPFENEALMDFGDVSLATLVPAADPEPDYVEVLVSSTPDVEEEPASNMFANVEEIINRLCAGKTIPLSAEPTSCPTSPAQNVPNIAEVFSPKSDVSEEMVLSPCSDEDFSSSPSSPVTQDQESAARRSPTKAGVAPSPYGKEKAQHWSPKQKTPLQRKRKRDQNKDAATRYRVKKREEHDTVKKELAGLEKDNVGLKDQVNSLSKEIEYLKNLMLEVYKTKLQKQSQIAFQVK